MRERIISILLLLLAAITIWAIVTELPKKEYAKPASDFTEAIRGDTPAVTADGTPATPSVATEVIRLHILADSDDTEDQAIKLALRDALLPYLNAATLTASTKEEALAQLTQQCGTLTELANATLTRLGADYTATVSLETLYFPIRIYGSQTYLSEDAVIFPPGLYDSVQVILGSGKGHNWWCLAYPSLCFIDASYDYVPKDSNLYQLKLGTLEKNQLTELFYGTSDTSGDNGEATVYLGSKLWELLQKLFS